MVKRTEYDYINRTRVHRGDNPEKLVDQIYRHRDHAYRPRNENPVPRHDRAENKEAARQDGVRPHTKDDVFNLNVPQHPANFHDKNYDNDASGWVRGCKSGEPTCNNEDATVKPFFDTQNAWRQKDGSIHTPRSARTPRPPRRRKVSLS